jgi:hypothetical protein
MKKFIIAFALLALSAAPALADYPVKDGNGTIVTMGSKDIGSGVQAGKHALIDTTNVLVDPATKQNQQAAIDRLGDLSSPAAGSVNAQLATTIARLNTLITAIGALPQAGAAIQATSYLPQAITTARSGLFGTTASQLMPTNGNRHFIVVQVQSASASCYIRGGGSTATADQNSLLIAAGAYFEPSTHIGTGAISIICTGASTPVYAVEG